ncbi:hypothetical protein V8J88_16775 [Massilia sp. W12]|uniref:hypothetical protein n=1 Tax=Massilia sp. W12 TaxID=3126507 RepID=UPI0030D5B959
MNDPIPTRPISEQEKILRQKFYEAIPAQCELMDKLAERLLGLELAIPGLYVTALTLLQGKDPKLVLSLPVYLGAGAWLLALLCTLLALFPRVRKVDTRIFKQDPARLHEGIGIEDFFVLSAHDKRRWLIASCLLFFAGILCALLSLG